MLLIALIGAFVLYAALVIFYEAAAPSLNTPPSILVSLRNAILTAPEPLPLLILKWGLILFAFYILGDAILSFIKRTRHK